MNQRSGKTIEQVMEDLNNMISGKKKKDSGNGGQGGGSGQSAKGNSGGIFLQWTLILLFVIVYGALSSFYKIDTTEQGVITRFGAFYGIADEGPHFKMPFGIDQVFKVEVTRIHEEQFGFRKDNKQISEAEARQESLMLTGDLKLAVVEWIVQYKIHDPRKFLFSAEGVRNNIRDITISVMRRVVGDKLVSDVLTTGRIFVAEQAKRLTQETLDRFDMGITITNLNLQNVTPPLTVRDAFNDVNIARQEKDQMVNQARGSYNKVIPEAEGSALRIVAEAEAYAINLVNKAKGDSEKFGTVLVSYRKAPEITRKRLYLETMEEIFSKGQRLTIVDSQIKGLLPVFSELGMNRKKSESAEIDAAKNEN